MQVLGVENAARKTMLTMLGEFLDLDAIYYHDLGDGEDYDLVKNGRTIRLIVRGSKIDGGYMLCQRVE